MVEDSVDTFAGFGAARARVSWGGAAWNLPWVTVGSTIAGSVLMGAAFWTASRPAAGSRMISAPAE